MPCLLLTLNQTKICSSFTRSLLSLLKNCCFRISIRGWMIERTACCHCCNSFWVCSGTAKENDRRQNFPGFLYYSSPLAANQWCLFCSSLSYRALTPYSWNKAVRSVARKHRHMRGLLFLWWRFHTTTACSIQIFPSVFSKICCLCRISRYGHPGKG